MAKIAYVDMPGVTGKYFRCEPYRSTMSVTSCAGMYRAEAGRQDGRHPHCNGCTVGALHAGDKIVKSSGIFGSKLCPRCRNPANRIVRGVCVSCINREYEVVRGCNAKGAVPTRLKPLVPMSVSCSVGGDVKAVNFPRVTDRVEAMLRVLRTQPGDVEFAWSAPMPAMSQHSLFGRDVTLGASA